MNKYFQKTLYWFPRIFPVLFALFLGIFALDVFVEGRSFWETSVALFMHLIPNGIILILTYVGWKNEKFGGFGFLLLGVLFTVFFGTYKNISSFLLVSLPLFITGATFLLYYYTKE